MSLVLIAAASNPDHGVASNWRAATPSPGSAPADSLPPPADPLGDDDGDGVPNILAHVAGGAPAIEIVEGLVSFERDVRADALLEMETSTDMITWESSGTDAVSRTELGADRERLAWFVPTGAGSPRGFVRFRVKLP